MTQQTRFCCSSESQYSTIPASVPDLRFSMGTTVAAYHCVIWPWEPRATNLWILPKKLMLRFWMWSLLRPQCLHCSQYRPDLSFFFSTIKFSVTMAGCFRPEIEGRICWGFNHSTFYIIGHFIFCRASSWLLPGRIAAFCQQHYLREVVHHVLHLYHLASVNRYFATLCCSGKDKPPDEILLALWPLHN